MSQSSIFNNQNQYISRSESYSFSLNNPVHSDSHSVSKECTHKKAYLSKHINFMSQINTYNLITKVTIPSSKRASCYTIPHTVTKALKLLLFIAYSQGVQERKFYQETKTNVQTSFSRCSSSPGRKCPNPYWDHGVGAKMRDCQSLHIVSPKVILFHSPSGELGQD